MMPLTIAETAQIEDASKSNRAFLPPLGIAAIGHFQAAMIPAFFGGLQAKGVIPSQPLNTAWDKITGFSHPVPDYNTDGVWSEGMIPSWDDDEITVAFAGMYQAIFVLSADAEAAAEYWFKVFLNGSPIGAERGTGVLTASGTLGIGSAEPMYVGAGARIALYGRADQNARTFDMQAGMLFLTRVR